VCQANMHIPFSFSFSMCVCVCCLLCVIKQCCWHEIKYKHWQSTTRILRGQPGRNRHGGHQRVKAGGGKGRGVWRKRTKHSMKFSCLGILSPDMLPQYGRRMNDACTYRYADTSIAIATDTDTNTDSHLGLAQKTQIHPTAEHQDNGYFIELRLWKCVLHGSLSILFKILAIKYFLGH